VPSSRASTSGPAWRPGRSRGPSVGARAGRAAAVTFDPATDRGSMLDGPRLQCPSTGTSLRAGRTACGEPATPHHPRRAGGGQAAGTQQRDALRHEQRQVPIHVCRRRCGPERLEGAVAVEGHHCRDGLPAPGQPVPVDPGQLRRARGEVAPAHLHDLVRPVVRPAFLRLVEDAREHPRRGRAPSGAAQPDHGRDPGPHQVLQRGARVERVRPATRSALTCSTARRSTAAMSPSLLPK
jgi:hypothetical protein